MTDVTKIILDCDPGYDDAVALLLAAGDPRIELLAVTTVAGNQSIEKVTGNARRILRAVGREDIPVAAGAIRPLVRGGAAFCPEIHGESGLDGTTLPEAVTPVDARAAAQLIVDTIMREPAGTVMLVPTGPLTNIALAARLEPRIVERVKEVVLMGGGCKIGNVKPFAEFNVEFDPEAAYVVFNEAWKVTMVGLDLTYQARADEAVRARARAIATKPGQLLADILDAFARNYKKKSHFDAPPVHDPCAVAAVIDRSVVKCVPVPIDVELRGALTYGMTVADFRRPAPEGCRTFAAVELDQPRFWDMVIEAVERIGDPLKDVEY